MRPFAPLAIPFLALWSSSAYCQGHDPYLLFQLNGTLFGRVRPAKPLAAPCFDGDDAGCAALKSALSNNTLDAGLYPSFLNIQGEACMADPTDQCLLDPDDLSPRNSSCQQGLVSPYYVQISDGQDVKSILEYARASNITLSVKNSGHDYMIRSSRKGSLAIWTKGLNRMEFHPSFSPAGCKQDLAIPPVAAITMQSGVTMDEAMVFSHSHGVLFSSGSSPSVGASGGWLLNGGHSPISVGLGLAVDRVLQFTVVTPDGETRIANRCSNPDLFWALRGAGGGGVFGIVLDSTHLAEPERPMMSASFFITNTSTEIKKGLVDVLAKNMRDLALAGWGGPSTPMTSFLVNPFVTDLIEAQRMLTPVTNFVQKPEAAGQAIFNIYPTWFEFWAQVVNGSTPDGTTGVGTGMVLTSKVIPETTFVNDTSRATMVDAIMELDQEGYSPTFLTVAPIRYAHTNLSSTGSGTPDYGIAGTSINPAWYRSIWHLAVYRTWNSSSSFEQRAETVVGLDTATALLHTLTDDGCTYSNEADIWLEDWENEYWGAENYVKLLEVKGKYDPDGLLGCWHCVGWEPWVPDYGCISGLKQ